MAKKNVKKTVAKTVTAKAAEKASVKAVEAPAAEPVKVEKKEEKAVEKTAAPKKRATRKPAKTIVLQYMGREINEADLTERALAQFAATEGAVAVKKITMYLKPEDNAAYYLINDQYTGRVDF